MVDLLARRTAASDAAFFTPALRPGMRLLDCGCGPGALGVREEDWGGTFFHPTSPVLERSMAVVLDDWRATGGDPFLPRRYRELLGRVGFTHIRTSATAVTRDLEEAQRWSELCAAYLLAPATKARVLEAGLADAQTLEDIRVAWLSWGRDASAFWSFTFCEAVALKTA